MKESVEMGRGQSHELCLKLEQAGLTSGLAQEVINAKNNELAKKMIAAILPAPAAIEVSSSFEKLAEFQLIVPEKFLIKTFRKKHKKGFSYFDPNLIDKNFNPSQPLLPGVTKTALIYRLKKRKTSDECLAFISSQNGQLPNAQGLAIAWEQEKANFPKGFWVIGFDQKENLWEDSDGNHRVPNLYQNSDGDAEFNLGFFGIVWDGDCCVLFFRD